MWPARSAHYVYGSHGESDHVDATLLVEKLVYRGDGRCPSRVAEVFELAPLVFELIVLM